MSDEELIQKLEEFAEHLSVGNIFTDAFRTLGWMLLKGIGILVDGLESVTNQVLLVKEFFQNPEIVAFVDTMRPFLYILLAFSLLFTGYMLIFQKKIEREAIAINIFIAIIIVGLLSNGMEKVNDFTDEAVKTVQSDGGLYGENESGTVSENILSKNITDLIEFDNNSFSNKDIDPTNTIPHSLILGLKSTEKFEKDDLSSNQGEEISQHYIVWTKDGKDVEEFDQGGIDWNNEYYYRYDIDWFNAIVTLLVMGFTLFSIAYKLARLGFELTFNYVLALLVAPADVHDGQKTKRVLQSILNTFIVIMLIFISMKIYMFGTTYLANNFEGLTYLIALIGFSVALIDGPNMVERIFGIDAGLKNGWGLLAGAAALTKAVSSTGRAIKNSLGTNGEVNPNSPNSDENNKNNNNKNNKNNNSNLNSNLNNGKDDNGNDLISGNEQDENNDTNNDKLASMSDADAKAPLSNGISDQMEQSSQQNDNASKAPSPNDVDKKEIDALAQSNNASATQTANGSDSVSEKGSSFGLQTNAEVSQSLDEQMGQQPLSQNGSVNDGATTPLSNQQSVSPNNVSGGTIEGGMQQQNQSYEQRSGIVTNSEVATTMEEQQGTTTVNQTGSGSGVSSTTQVAPSMPNNASFDSVNQNISDSSIAQQQTRTTNVQNTGGGVIVNDEVIMNNEAQQVQQGSTTVRETGDGSVNVSGGNSSFIPRDVYNQEQSISGENQVVNNNVPSQTITNTTTVNNENTKIRPSKYVMNQLKKFTRR
ncbi:MAG: pLS20_p028 family conjugation system transmembrane protein [Bacillaceae bacterium]